MMFKRTAMLCGVLAIVLASSALAFDRVVDGTPAVKRAPAEVSVNGVTPEEFLERQRELHAWLITQMPEGVDRAVVSVTLTDQERASITAPQAGGEATPMRVGVVKSLREQVGLVRGQDLSRTAKAAHSVMTQAADGGFVWATAVSSPDAVALRVHLTDFSMPANAEVYFLSREGEAYGPYVGAGPDDSGDFWTNSVMSSTGIVLVRYYGTPEADDLAGLSLRVSEVGHVAIDFPRPAADGGIASFCTFNEPCVENATCQNTGPAAAAETAVAKMRWIKRPFVYICTGGLIADTDPGTQIPYFLTANHCISADKVAANLEAYFLYQVSCGTSICAGSFDPAPAPSTLGATVVATNSDGDFTLLRLNEAPPAGTTYLGWNNSPIAYTAGADLYRIHHPSGAPQAYSEHEVDTAAVTCSGWPRGERIYSNDVYGATEGGSSGSPVLNASGEIVGQLSGCCGYNCGDVCDTASNSTVDGALAYYWAAVEPFLSPSSGCTTDDDCDDNDACNGLETCVATVCQAGTPVDCDDGDACTTDSCAPATGACSNDPISCNDGEACTADSCDPATGCINDWAACGLADGCCGPDCDSTNDPDCEECVPSGGYCTSSAECCSGSCHPAKHYCR